MVSSPNPRRRGASAEAAAWIARLQSADRTESTEAGLRRWLDDDPGNKEAFERATEVWGIIPGAALLHCEARLDIAVTSKGGKRYAMPARTWGFALAASLLLLVGSTTGWWLMSRPVQYVTERGEQEMATLQDGSRISLNTDTALRVRYDNDRRQVRLDHGEAMFEVAPNLNRPFIVTAGSKTVTALGTSFIVRRTGSDVVVTLIEGKVAVDDAREAAAAVDPEPVILAPGERLKVVTDRFASIDRPSLEAATAWRQGQAVFDDAPLSIAVAELNRYGGPQILIEDPRVASMRVSGVFATNDTAEFARAIAALHGLRVERNEGGLRIVR